MTAPPVAKFVIDANVLIDYLKAAPSVLTRAARDLGTIYVPSPVVREVNGLDAARAERLGLNILVPEMEELFWAGGIGGGRLSFEDLVCYILARERGMTCVTNDKQLRKRCRSKSVKTCWGMELMVRLVGNGSLTATRAIGIAEKIYETNPQKNAAVLERFRARISAAR